MRFVERSKVAALLADRTVAIVGSGPGSLNNAPGFVDSHDIVVRVNNYKLFPATGSRTDVFYSFFGTSIRKSSEQLRRDGVKLCLCKCPDAQFMESAWHRARGKMNGVDFRYIYQVRKDWWFCDTYVPSVEEFLAHFELLGGHVPTTGFAAVLDVLSFKPRSLYLTGFDFFQSQIHNVDERWRRINHADPIGHVPDAERSWMLQNAGQLPVTMDTQMQAALAGKVRPQERLISVKHELARRRQRYGLPR